jgi:hypothetical protein
MKPSRSTEVADHRDFAGARSRGEDGRCELQTRDQQRNVLGCFKGVSTRVVEAHEPARVQTFGAEFAVEQPRMRLAWPSRTVQPHCGFAHK